MSGHAEIEERVLVFAPTGRDAALACSVLMRGNIRAHAVRDVDALCLELAEGAGAVLIAEEALSPAALVRLSELLAKQAPWSDLPFIVFGATVDSATTPARLQQMADLIGNVTMVERPVRVATLVTTTRAALRARIRQYTARKTLLDLERQDAELKRADQRKDEFLAMLAHELRNPMAAISMALSLLERADNDAPKRTRYRQTARRQMSNLVRLVDDLLDVARITRGTVELRKETLDLAVVLHGAVAAARPTIESRRHELRLSVAPGTFLLQADTTRLEQVVANLLSNAAKYTEPGGRISVKLTSERAGDRDWALLRVADTGRGIPPHMLEGIFDMFVQVDQSLDRSLGGLGLGLTLVRRLVEMHGGSVRAWSAGPGKGTEMLVRLPLDGASSSLPRPDKQLAIPNARSRRRVLIVEDSEDIRETLKELLELLGHEVEVASDGVEGMAKLLDWGPEVALVDVGLPGMNGYEVARRVRAMPGGDRFYLVALTGYGGPEAREKAELAGFDLHVTKPLDVSSLPEMLTRTRH